MIADSRNPPGYHEGLLAALRAARAAGEGSTLWLLADRLVRMSEGREPLVLLMRAEGLAMLGEREAAWADVLAAFRIEPTLPGLLERVLTGLSEPGQCRAALSHAFRHGVAPTPPLLEVLRREGVETLLLTRAKEDEVRGDLFWHGAGLPAPQVLHEGGVDALPLQPVGEIAGAPALHRAQGALRWPEGARWVAPRLAGALVVPEALLTSGPLPQPQGAPHDGLMVIVPAYADWPSLESCLASVLPQLGAAVRLVIVEDASPEPAVVEGLARHAGLPQVTLLRNPVNLGFAGAVNRALALRKSGEDVLLLNADATLAPGALARLRALSRSQPGIGTLTPLSNNGEDTSVPMRFRPNPEPDAANLAALDRAAARANGDALVDLPNGVGFCLYVTGAALDAVGGLSGTFERGYFEDVDLCLRIAAAGFRNACAIGVYVAHAGTRSFGAEKDAWVRRNRQRLHGLYPNYAAQLVGYVAADPLAGAADALARAYCAAVASPVVMVMPDDLPLDYARPLAQPHGVGVFLSAGADGWRVAMPDRALSFTLPAAPGALAAALPWLANSVLVSLDAARLPAFAQETLSAWPIQPLVLVQDVAGERGPLPPGRIGLALPEMSALSAAQLLPVIAGRGGCSYVFLDEIPFEHEIGLVSRAGVYFVGPVAPAELRALACRAGFDAVLFAHPRYAGLDPRRAAAREAGLKVLDLPAA